MHTCIICFMTYKRNIGNIILLNVWSFFIDFFYLFRWRFWGVYGEFVWKLFHKTIARWKLVILWNFPNDTRCLNFDYRECFEASSKHFQMVGTTECCGGFLSYAHFHFDRILRSEGNVAGRKLLTIWMRIGRILEFFTEDFPVKICWRFYWNFFQNFRIFFENFPQIFFLILLKFLQKFSQNFCQVSLLCQFFLIISLN